MIAIFIRTVIIYLLLTVSMRFSGKRQVGQLRVPEVTAVLLISEIAALPLTDTDIPLMYAIVPIAALTSIEIIFSFLSTKSSIIKRAVGTLPSFIIERGKINRSQLEKNRLSLDDLMAELRQNGVSSPSDVEYAIMEENGSISVILKGEKQPITQGDIGKSKKECLSMPIIIDGHAVTYALSHLGKDKEWLRREVLKKDLCISDIFLMTANEENDFLIITKRESEK